MKKIKFILLCTFIILLLSNINVSGDESIEINDSLLLEALSCFDSNGDGKLQKNELPDYSSIVLDGYNIKSVEGLEEIRFNEISMKNCNLTELPEGIENLCFDKLYLNDNQLTDVDGLKGILENLQYEYGDYQIYIDGNPFYNEVIDYLFNDYYYNLSIIGIVGTSSWQKMEFRHNLSIDDMNTNSWDVMRIYPTIVTNNSGLDEWTYEIEDTSIAEIVGTKQLRRYYTYIGAHDEYQVDEVLEIRLLKEGHTRMKISSGSYVKYTDIWVLPRSSEGTETGQFMIPYISDIEIGAYLIERYGTKEYSGIYNCSDFLNSEAITVFGSSYNIKDFTTFSLVENLSKIRLREYSNDSLRSILGLEKIQTLKEVEIYASEEQWEVNDDFITSCKYIKGILGDDFSIVFDIANKMVLISKNSGERMKGDIDNNELINPLDALLILKKAAGIKQFDNEELILSDVNEDSIVNTKDALEVLKYAAGLIKEFN